MFYSFISDRKLKEAGLRVYGYPLNNLNALYKEVKVVEIAFWVLAGIVIVSAIIKIVKNKKK